MIDIKVKTKDKKFTVPIPYPFLSMCITVIPSKFITRLINRQTKNYNNKKNSTYTIPLLDKKLLKQMIRELKKHKGTEIVYVKAKDGSEITIKL